MPKVKYFHLVVFIFLSTNVFGLNKEKLDQEKSKYEYKEVKKEESQIEDKTPITYQESASPPDFSFASYLFYGLLITGGLIGLYFLFQKYYNLPQRQRFKPVKWSSLEDNIIELPELSELEKMLKIALDEQNYRVSIRIRYLLLLQKLDERRFIHWKPFKTNLEYSMELPTPLDQTFFELYPLIDGVWFGKWKTSAQHDQYIARLIDHLSKSMKG